MLADVGNNTSGAFIPAKDVYTYTEMSNKTVQFNNK
jgi:hypothetical protein